MSKAERMRILEQLERGEISPEEAAEQLASGKARPQASEASTPMEVLEALDKGELSTEEALERIERTKSKAGAHIVEPRQWADDLPEMEEAVQRKRGPWMAALWLGVLLSVAGAAWMNARLQASGMDLWFYCAWLPLVLGVGLIVLAWSGRNSPWLNLRVRSSDGGKDFRLRMGFPLPLGLARMGLGAARAYISDDNRVIADIALDKLEAGLRPGEPIVIRVDDEDDGDQVELIIA
ncbi:MAG: hypothetical protein DWG76_01255 [Chloroflexi bacterium]|nr:hypothetical protein [Chloroflexota bacterium]